MAKTTPKKAAPAPAVAKGQETRADRLNAMTARYGDGSKYVIETVKDGIRVVIEGAEGDRVAGSGKDIEAAIKALEPKIKGSK